MSQYFDIYNDGTNTYDAATLAKVSANLAAGLIAYGYGDTFTLLGTDGINHTFQNNEEFQPIAPATPIPTPPPTPPPSPIVIVPAKPINQDKKPTNNNISGTSTTDVSFIAATAIFGALWYYKYYEL